LDLVFMGSMRRDKKVVLGDNMRFSCAASSVLREELSHRKAKLSKMINEELRRDSGEMWC
jgi:hypothetical protein